MPKITHEQLTAALAQADRTKLVMAARAVLTNRLWDLTDDQLRELLSEEAHLSTSSHEEVWAGLGLELPSE